MTTIFYENTARINLTTGQILSEKTNPDLAARFLGGRGLGAWYLQKENIADKEALSPDNLLIFSTGPMTCNFAPSAGRSSIVTKSPVSGRICASNSSGNWGEKLKCAGWDTLILEGRAAELSYLLIQDNHISIKTADFLSQKLTDETVSQLKSIYGDDAVVLTIGPAGENLEMNAAIIQDQERAAGKNAIGAVMGSKNLKAIVLSSSRTDLSHLLSDLVYLNNIREEISSRFSAASTTVSCKRCVLPCGHASEKISADPELQLCNRLGIDAAKKGKKAKYYSSMSQNDLYLNAVIDSIGLCMFAAKHMTIDQIVKILNAITGFSHTDHSLLQIGKAICELEECFSAEKK